MPPQGENKDQHVEQIRKEVKDRIIGFIVGAFGLVAGLAWNDAVKAFIESVFPLPNDSIPAKFMYAIIISLVAVFITVYMMRLLQPPPSPPANKP